MRKWEELPSNMQTEQVRYYYDILCKKQFSMIVKRCFDVIVSLLLILLLLPVFLVLAIAIKIDSKGPVFYRQKRVTRYGKIFRIHKFRSMIVNADKQGTLVTVKSDDRITKVGKLIRKCRLDEICQLIDVLEGNMTFVGTRPEVPKYVEKYTPEMMATLLLPAGITSEACIRYKDEEKLLDSADDVENVYIEKVLPGKMYYNLKDIEHFSFFGGIATMFRTVLAVFGKDYKGDFSDKKETKEKETVIR